MTRYIVAKFTEAKAYWVLPEVVEILEREFLISKESAYSYCTQNSAGIWDLDHLCKLLDRVSKNEGISSIPE